VSNRLFAGTRVYTIQDMQCVCVCVRVVSVCVCVLGSSVCVCVSGSWVEMHICSVCVCVCVLGSWVEMHTWLCGRDKECCVCVYSHMAVETIHCFSLLYKRNALRLRLGVEKYHANHATTLSGQCDQASVYSGNREVCKRTLFGVLA
jgi:hypothetical protein